MSLRLEIPPSRSSPDLRARTNMTSNCCRFLVGKPAEGTMPVTGMVPSFLGQAAEAGAARESWAGQRRSGRSGSCLIRTVRAGHGDAQHVADVRGNDEVGRLRCQSADVAAAAALVVASHPAIGVDDRVTALKVPLLTVTVAPRRADPCESVAVTAMRSVVATSRFLSRYAFVVAPMIDEQLPPFASQRSH